MGRGRCEARQRRAEVRFRRTLAWFGVMPNPSTTVLQAKNATERATRQLLQQCSGDKDAQCRDGVGVMPLAPRRAASSWTELRVTPIEVFRPGPRGKNGFVPQLRSRKRQWKV